MSEATNLAFWDAVDALVGSDEVLAAADRLEQMIGGRGGRPRSFHAYHHLVLHLLCAGHYRQRVRLTFVEVNHPEAWAFYRRTIRQRHPGRADLDPGPVPMRRHHFVYFKRTYLQSPAAMDLISAAFEAGAVDLARELQLCTGTTGGSWTLPSLNDVIQGDGKVVRPISRWKPGDEWVDADTGEIKSRRSDPDIGRYREGGKTTFTPGHKLTFLQTRTDEAGERVVLGVEPGGDELGSALRMVDRIHAELPEARVFAYDGALRGVHRAHFMERFGMLCVSPANGTKNEDVEPKWMKLGTAFLRRDDGTVEDVLIETFEGRPYVMEIGVDGSQVPMPLVLHKIKKSTQRGNHRFYGDYDFEGVGTVRIRFHQTDEDRVAKMNRPERLHPYPIKTDHGRALYGRRPDAESMNRQFEDACWQGRAPGYGQTTVLLGAVGWAFAQNCMTAFRLARKLAPPGENVAA